jgi:hypothetical protein
MYARDFSDTDDIAALSSFLVITQSRKHRITLSAGMVSRHTTSLDAYYYSLAPLDELDNGPGTVRWVEPCNLNHISETILP